MAEVGLPKGCNELQYPWLLEELRGVTLTWAVTKVHSQIWEQQMLGAELLAVLGCGAHLRSLPVKTGPSG